jgi:hypothetical protein
MPTSILLNRQTAISVEWVVGMGRSSSQRGSGGSGIGFLATSPPIGEALSARTLDCPAGALGIVNPELDAIRIAEVELGEVAVKVPLGAVLIDAGHSALEDREIAFNGVGVSIAAHPFLAPVIDGFVTSEAPADRAVRVRLIGAEMARGVGILHDHAADFARGHILDFHGAGFAATFD